MTKKKVKKVKLGTLPPETEDDLDMLALVTPSDIEEAKRASFLSPLMRALLATPKADAEADEGVDNG